MPVMKDPKGYFRKDQVLTMLNSVKEYRFTKRDRLLIFTLWKSGKRISEIVGFFGITPNDIDAENYLIRYRIMKTVKRRKSKRETEDQRYERLLKKQQDILRQNKTMVRALIKYIQENDIDRTTQIFPFTRNRADQIIKDTAMRAGIKFIGEKLPHCHHFRHTFAMEKKKKKLKKGETRLDRLYTLKKAMSHRNVNNTLEYFEMEDEDLGDMVDD